MSDAPPRRRPGRRPKDDPTIAVTTRLPVRRAAQLAHAAQQRQTTVSGLLRGILMKTIAPPPRPPK